MAGKEQAALLSAQIMLIKNSLELLLHSSDSILTDKASPEGHAFDLSKTFLDHAHAQLSEAVELMSKIGGRPVTRLSELVPPNGNLDFDENSLNTEEPTTPPPPKSPHSSENLDGVTEPPSQAKFLLPLKLQVSEQSISEDATYSPVVHLPSLTNDSTSPISTMEATFEARSERKRTVKKMSSFLESQSSAASSVPDEWASKLEYKVAERRKDSEWRDKASRAQEAFILFDEDGNGVLGAEDMLNAMDVIGIPEENVQNCIDRIMSEVDDDRTGTVNMKEFVEFFTRDLSYDPVLLSIQNAFSLLTDDLVQEFEHRTKDMIVGSDKYLIDPRSSWSLNWDIYVAILLVVTIFTMPLSMAFDTMQTALKPLDLTADITFIMDICKHFNTGFIDEQEYMIMDRKKVQWRYAMTWFVPDLFSSLPIEFSVTKGPSEISKPPKL